MSKFAERRIGLLFAIVLLYGCVVTGQLFAQANRQPTVQFAFAKQDVDSDSSLRGLCVVDANIVWATGSKGTILRTVDGQNWNSLKLPHREDVEIRDVFAWDSEHAIVMIAGQPAELWETVDGGVSWGRVFVDGREAAFLDDILIDPATGEGLAFGDVVRDSIPLVSRSADGKWHLREDLADLGGRKYLHGYAASGTSMVRLRSGRYLIGTGGSPENSGTSSVLMSLPNQWRRWETVSCEIPATESAGIFSLATDGQYVVAVGGDYLKPEENNRVAAYSTDGGQSWSLSEIMPGGYRSGAALVWPATAASLPAFVCVGTNGSDVSFDAGKSWETINTLNLNAVRFDSKGTTGWAVGGAGAIYRISVSQE